MAAVEMFPSEVLREAAVRPDLRVVRTENDRPWRTGPLVSQRRAARARMLRRRRRTMVAAAAIGATVLLAWPVHAFGNTNAAGLSYDLTATASLQPGMKYVVQSTDTVNSIAKQMNPVNPSYARRLLVAELRSNTVVSGEQILIP